MQYSAHMCTQQAMARVLHVIEPMTRQLFSFSIRLAYCQQA